MSRCGSSRSGAGGLGGCDLRSRLIHFPAMSCPAAFAAIAVLVLLTARVLPQIPDELLYIPAPPVGTESERRLGYATAIDGEFAVVGVPYEDSGPGDAGAVRIYHRTTGALLHRLRSPNPKSGGRFGTGVSISGTRVAVSSFSDPQGNAYVFDLAAANPATPVVVLKPPVVSGSAISISGSIVAVGGGNRVNIYNLSALSPGTAILSILNPNAPNSYGFGAAVAVSGDRIVVGRPGEMFGTDSSGRAFVYDLNRLTPDTPIATLENPSPAEGDHFGAAVSISGTRVLIGAYQDDTSGTDAGSAYVFDLASATPGTPVTILNSPAATVVPRFGYSAALSGTRAVVGAYLGDGPTNTGRAYVYELAGPAPTTPILTLNNPSPAVDDNFGFSVGISSDRIIAGAPYDDTGASNAGGVYIYDPAAPSPQAPVLTIIDPGPSPGDVFGTAVALSGTHAVVGATQFYVRAPALPLGTAYLFDLARPSPAVPVLTFTKPNPASFDFFGGAVAVSGRWVAVAAASDDTGNKMDSGSVYLYDLNGQTPSLPALTLRDPSPAANDYFGEAIAMSGTRIIVGASTKSSGAVPGAGIAHVFDLAGAAPPVPVFTLNGPPAVEDDRFGSSVAIDGNKVVVGAYGRDEGAPLAGAAYVFDLAGATPLVPILTLLNPEPASDDRFGGKVAISGSKIIVGCSLDDTGASNAGSAYIYDLNSAVPATPVLILRNPEPAANAGFGGNLSIKGTKIAAGPVGPERRLFLYDIAGASPSDPLGALPATWAGGVAIGDSWYLVGSPGDATVMHDKGGAFLYGHAAASPLATLSNPDSVKAKSATLRGTVNPNGLATEVRFEYGLTTAYGSQTPLTNPGRGFGPQPVTAAITGLTPDTEYHFRLVVTHAGGTVIVEDAVFRTTHPGYAEWAESHNAGAANADDDEDGVVNLLEFAFGLDPQKGSSFQIPQPVVQPNGQVRLETILPAGYGGLQVSAEHSAGLTGWTAIPNSGEAGHPVFIAPVGGGRQFVRWRVTLLP